MTGNSEAAHVLTVALLGILLLVGVLATISYLVGASAQDLVPSRPNLLRAVREARSWEKGATPLTLRYVLGFGLLASAPTLLAAAVLFVTVQRPTYWYWWLIGGVVLAVGLLVLSDVVGRSVAAEKVDANPSVHRGFTLRKLAGTLIGVAALFGAAANVGGLLFTGEPLFPPHPLNPLFPLALIVLASVASRLIRERTSSGR